VDGAAEVVGDLIDREPVEVAQGECGAMVRRERREDRLDVDPVVDRVVRVLVRLLPLVELLERVALASVPAASGRPACGGRSRSARRP
jgi:hypothetical protein